MGQLTILPNPYITVTSETGEPVPMCTICWTVWDAAPIEPLSHPTWCRFRQQYEDAMRDCPTCGRCGGPAQANWERWWREPVVRLCPACYDDEFFGVRKGVEADA